MVSFKIIGVIVAVIAIVFAVVVLGGFVGKQGAPAVPLTTAPVQNPTAASTTIPASPTQPYITETQAEGFVGPVQTSSIKVLNTSASIAKFSQNLVANASAVWMAIYAGAHNATISEVVVEAMNSSKAQAMYSLMTANAQYHPNYNFGTYDNMSYLEVPYNLTEHQAGFLAMKGRYDLFAFVTNESTVNVTSLVHVVARDLN